MKGSWIFEKLPLASPWFGSTKIVKEPNAGIYIFCTGGRGGGGIFKISRDLAVGNYIVAHKKEHKRSVSTILFIEICLVKSQQKESRKQTQT